MGAACTNVSHHLAFSDDRLGADVPILIVAMITVFENNYISRLVSFTLNQGAFPGIQESCHYTQESYQYTLGAIIRTKVY